MLKRAPGVGRDETSGKRTALSPLGNCQNFRILENFTAISNLHTSAFLVETVPFQGKEIIGHGITDTNFERFVRKPSPNRIRRNKFSTFLAYQALPLLVQS